MSATPELRDFVFAEKIGKGSYATVYKAYRKDDKREVVAIKCVLKSSLTKSSVENLLTEISILKKVKHENIVELKDFQWDNNYIYIILEYCSGGDLSCFIRRKNRLPETVVQRFLQRLARALQVLRSHNIAHMDLKPQNILLSSPQHPVLKLGDFGFAQYLHPGGAGSSLRGSPLYMAPEILLKHEYDARVDLWSVGIILYECLFGQAPFSSNTFSELAEKIRSSKEIELPYGVNLSDECRSLLLGLLRRDPNRRLTFDEFFNHSFVDLEHMPTAESYSKGVNYVQQAVQQDADGNFEAAVRLYGCALEYLVPHVHNEPDHIKRRELRKKVFEYMNRAEELKKCVKGVSVADDDLNSSSEIELLLSSSATLRKALNLAAEADSLVKNGRFEEAGKFYQDALELMVPAVAVEQPGRRKELLYAEVSKWMKKAEELKSFLRVTEYRRAEIENIASNSKTIRYNAVSESLASRCGVQ